MGSWGTAKHNADPVGVASYARAVTFWIIALALFAIGVVLITLAVRDHR